MTTATLDELVIDVRAEIGDSTNMAMGVDKLPAIQQTIRRIQQTYYEDFDWPHLVFDPEEDVLPNERYYTFNEGINPDRIFKVWSKVNDQWREMEYGINPEHYNQLDPERGRTEAYPRRWSFYGDNQFEIWPLPSIATRIKFRCIRALPPLRAGTDTCLLDPTLLVLTAAAELAARAKLEDAKLKLSVAAGHYTKLKARWQKNRVFSVVPLPASSGRCIPRAPR